MNINMLMQQAQRMQKDMESNIKKAKEELAQTEVHAEAGGGLVKVTMTGRYIVKRIEINPELLLMRRLPTTLGAISWLVVFAILVTPTVSEGPNASVAPAIFGLLFGVLTKDSPLIWSNLSLILFVIGLGLVIGYCWSKYITNKSMRSI